MFVDIRKVGCISYFILFYLWCYLFIFYANFIISSGLLINKM